MIVNSRIAQWKSDTQFNFGSPIFNNVEVGGSGEAAYLRLAKKTPNSDDVPFTTPANYIYNATKIEVAGGVAKLKATITHDYNWPFTIPANYTYDGNKIEVAGGVAKLKENALLDYKGYYRFEDNVEDSSGNNNNGINHGASFVSGKLGKAAKFNGSSNYIDITNSDFQFNDAITVLAWIKLDKVTGTQGICTSGEEAAQPYWLFQVYDDKLRVYVRNAYYVANISLSPGVWYFVAFAGTASGGGKIYLNGGDDGNISPWTEGGAGINASIGKSGGANYLDGLIDECAIFRRELPQNEIQKYYNSGDGEILGQYPTDNPKIVPNTNYPFNNSLGAMSETSTKPIGSEIKYHCSSDDGVTWKYWNGGAWVVTDNSYTQANTVSEINANISSLAASGTFKFRALLHSDSGSVTPELDNIYIAEGVSYPIGDYSIEMIADIQPNMVLNYATITETIIKPTNTDIKYQYSIDSGLTWNGSWLTEPGLEVALQGIVCNKYGSDKIRFKIRLSTTDGNVTPEIDNLNVVSTSGYETTGDYTSIVFDAYNIGQLFSVVDWKDVNFEIVELANTTIVIMQRTAKYVLDKHGEFEAVVSGTDLDTLSDIFQFKVKMTGNGLVTPRLNWLEVQYCLGVCYEKDITGRF